MHKKFWDVERGVTYIPWSKVKVDELDSYREGGMLDEETLNPGKIAIHSFLLFILKKPLQIFPLSLSSLYFVQSGIMPGTSISWRL